MTGKTKTRGRKKKIFHEVFRTELESSKGEITYMAFGWIENPTFKNFIYEEWINGHDFVKRRSEMTVDEALTSISGLAMAVEFQMYRRVRNAPITTVSEI